MAEAQYWGGDEVGRGEGGGAEGQKTGRMHTSVLQTGRITSDMFDQETDPEMHGKPVKMCNPACSHAYTIGWLYKRMLTTVNRACRQSGPRKTRKLSQLACWYRFGIAAMLPDQVVQPQSKGNGLMPAISVLSFAMAYVNRPAYTDLLYTLTCHARDSSAWPRCTWPLTH